MRERQRYQFRKIGGRWWRLVHVSLREWQGFYIWERLCDGMWERPVKKVHRG